MYIRTTDLTGAVLLGLRLIFGPHSVSPSALLGGFRCLFQHISHSCVISLSVPEGGDCFGSLFRYCASTGAHHDCTRARGQSRLSFLSSVGLHVCKLRSWKKALRSWGNNILMSVAWKERSF